MLGSLDVLSGGEVSLHAVEDGFDLLDCVEALAVLVEHLVDEHGGFLEHGQVVDE